MVHDVVHYCVANMPGAVARTSTFALNNATLPFTLALADLGAEKAMRANAHLRAGLNVYKGALTYKAVAEAQKLPFKSAEDGAGIVVLRRPVQALACAAINSPAPGSFSAVPRFAARNVQPIPRARPPSRDRLSPPHSKSWFHRISSL